MKYRILSLESQDGEVEMPDPIIWEPGMVLAKNQPYQIGGLMFFFELLAGDTRSGTDGQGNKWESILPAHYGHLLDTKGGDGEEVDIYVKDADCDFTADVHVIDQIDLKSGNWDEHKCMVGFADPAEAEKTYIKAFSDEKGQDRLGATCTVDADTFLAWIYGGDTQSAMATQDIPDMTIRKTKTGTDALGEIIAPAKLPEVPPRFGAYPLKLAPINPLSMCDLSQQDLIHYAIYLFGPLEMDPESRPIANDIVRLLKTAPEQAQFDFYIASPGGDLTEAMRICSAMKTTKAKVITHAVGPVASAAVILWAEGHERRIGSCAFFMQHMSSHGQSGKSSQIAYRAGAIINYLRHAVLPRQLEVGLWTEQEVADLLDKDVDLYITADEAIARVGAIA